MFGWIRQWRKRLDEELDKKLTKQIQEQIAADRALYELGEMNAKNSLKDLTAKLMAGLNLSSADDPRWCVGGTTRCSGTEVLDAEIELKSTCLDATIKVTSPWAASQIRESGGASSLIAASLTTYWLLMKWEFLLDEEGRTQLKQLRQGLAAAGIDIVSFTHKE